MVLTTGYGGRAVAVGSAPGSPDGTAATAGALRTFRFFLDVGGRPAPPMKAASVALHPLLDCAVAAMPSSHLYCGPIGQVDHPCKGGEAGGRPRESPSPLLSFSADGSRLLALDANSGSGDVYQVERDCSLKHVLQSSFAPRAARGGTCSFPAVIMDADVDGTGRWVAAVTQDHCAYSWSHHDGPLFAHLGDSADQAVRFSPDSRWLGLASQRRAGDHPLSSTVSLWDFQDQNRPALVLEAGCDVASLDLATSPAVEGASGSLAAAACTDGWVHVWRTGWSTVRHKLARAIASKEAPNVSALLPGGGH